MKYLINCFSKRNQIGHVCKNKSNHKSKTTVPYCDVIFETYVLLSALLTVHETKHVVRGNCVGALSINILCNDKLLIQK